MERKHSVGIFSRSDKSEYAWLVTLFTSGDFGDRVQDVRSTLVTNSGFQLFFDNALQCSLGIIYHTKNRGRINITDIPGSLYDEELKNLNELLGRDNVIVVIDDVEDSSDQEKLRILNLQPSIEKLACDLLLILKSEKNNTEALMKKLRNLAPFRSTSGRSTDRSSDLLYSQHNMMEKFTETTKARCRIEDLKALHSQDVSFGNEGPEIGNSNSGFKSLWESLAPCGGKKKHEVPSSNAESHTIWYNHESQITPPSTEDSETWHSSETENIYEIPDTLITYDIPKPQLYTEMSKMGNSKNLINKQWPETQYCSQPSKIDDEASKMWCSPDNSKELLNKQWPETQYYSQPSKIEDEASKMWCSTENSKKLQNKQRPETQYYSQPSKIDDEASQMWYSPDNSKKLPNKQWPKTQYCSQSSKIDDEASQMWCSPDNSKKLLNKQWPETQYYSQPSKINDEASQMWYSPDTSKKLLNKQWPVTQHSHSKIGCDFEISEEPSKKGFPMTQFDGEASKMWCNSENSKKLLNNNIFLNKSIEDTSETSIPSCDRSEDTNDNDGSLGRGKSLDTPVQDISPKPLSANKSLQSQLKDGKWSEVVNELESKHKLQKKS